MDGKVYRCTEKKEIEMNSLIVVSSPLTGYSSFEGKRFVNAV